MKLVERATETLAESSQSSSDRLIIEAGNDSGRVGDV